MKDFYKVLGVSAAATLSEIKAAHRSLSKKLHPDVNNGSKFFEEKFREIQEAYEVLSDTVKRNRYDLQWKSRNADDIPPNKPDNGFSGEKEYPIAKTESKQRHSFASWAIWAFFLLMIGVIMLLNIHHAKNNEGRILSEKEAANFYSNKKDERKRITDSISKILGRIFLYTNDSMATAFWSDDIVRRYTSGKDDISFNPPVFQKRESNPPFLVRLGDDSFSFGYSFTYHNSNTKKRLYFISYDNKDKLHRDTIKLKRDSRPAEEKWITGWGIGFTKIEDISTTLLDVPHLWTSVNLAKEVDGFLISMAGVEKDNQHPGLNLEEFMKSVRALNKILKKSGVDTTRFRLKIFTGLDSLPRYVRTHTRAAGESFPTDPIGLQVLFGQALLSCAICSALTPNVSCNSRATLPSGLIGCTRLGFTRR